MLVCLSEPASPLILEKLHLLPDEDNPLTLYLADSGHWICEMQDQLKTLVDGELIHCGPSIWRFFSAGPEAATLSRSKSDVFQRSWKVECSFLVSGDEEHVSLKLSHGLEKHDLGERAHHYTLLTLARQRLADHKMQIDPFETGWISFERLCDMLRLDVQHVNIHIYRARKQVMGCFPEAPRKTGAGSRKTGAGSGKGLILLV